MTNKIDIITATKDFNRVTPIGLFLGGLLLSIAEPMIKELASEGEEDERCSTCAFRKGTVPNGCEQTLMDALKCIKEDVLFGCHAVDGKACHGWFAARVAIKNGAELPIKTNWEFSKNE